MAFLLGSSCLSLLYPGSTLCMGFPTEDASFFEDEKIGIRSAEKCHLPDLTALRGPLAGYFLFCCSEVKEISRG